MTDPGRLNQRLVLDMPLETPDGTGGVVRTYAGGPLLWASVTPLAARGSVVADSAGASVTHRIIVRSGPQVTTRHRLRKGVRIFRIASVREDENGRLLVIEAQERTD